MTPTAEAPAPTPQTEHRDHIAALDAELLRRGVLEAVELLQDEADQDVAEALAGLNPAISTRILWALPDERRERILAVAPAERAEQWSRNQSFPEGSVGRLMDHPMAIFAPEATLGEVLRVLRDLVRRAFITYAWVTDGSGKLLGVLVFREMLFADESQRVEEIMLRDPFSLRPDIPVLDAMREVVARHYPVYPVCDAESRLVGTVRGQTLFEAQAIEISAQAGRMVGVEEEERVTTPWWRSLRFRHPWLQLNLLTAFLAAAVVGVFEETIAQVVVLAVFLPVLAGQSGNTGCQALAVTLRSMTLGELEAGRATGIIAKEGWLGLLNGAAVGVTAGFGMFVYAASQGHPQPLVLALVVWFAMLGSCAASGVAGAAVPLGLKRLGADPATASSIFLTTATDVASMGLFLGLASWVVL